MAIIRLWKFIFNVVMFLGALVLFVMTSRNLLLKYSDVLNLDEILVDVTDTILAQRYLRNDDVIQGFNVGGHWYYNLEGIIYRDFEKIDKCEFSFVGAMQVEDRVLLACEQSLHILDDNGTLLDIIDGSFDLATPISRLGRITQQIFIETESIIYNVDVDSFEFYILSADTGTVTWVNSEDLPSVVKENIPMNKKSVKRILEDWANDELLSKKTSRIIDLIMIWVLIFFINLLMGLIKTSFLALIGVIKKRY
jgi:hypothetical protein